MANKPYIYDIVIIVPKGIVNACNNDAKGWDALGGLATFTVGLSNTPSGPIVKYWANSRCNYDELVKMKDSVLIRQSVVAYVQSRGREDELNLLFGNMNNVTIGNYDPNEILQSEGLYRYEEDIS